MGDDVLPVEVTRFVVDCIPTVVHLEALLFLRSQPERDVAADDVGRQLWVETDAAVKVLVDLVAKRLVSATSPQGPFRYAPASAELAGAVDVVANVYRTRLIPLSRFIHEHASSRSMHDFANAFRLRKD